MSLFERAVWGPGGWEARAAEIEGSLGEPLREAWNANRAEHSRQVGGKLLLTGTRLVFYPHDLEHGTALRVIRGIAVPVDGVSPQVFRGEGSVWAASLAAVDGLEKTGRIVGFLRVTLDDDSQEQFRVSHVDTEVIPRISEAKASLDSASR